MERNCRHKFIPCGAVWLNRARAIYQKKKSQIWLTTFLWLWGFCFYVNVIWRFGSWCSMHIQVHMQGCMYSHSVFQCEFYDHFVMTSECLWICCRHKVDMSIYAHTCIVQFLGSWDHVFYKHTAVCMHGRVCVWMWICRCNVDLSVYMCLAAYMYLLQFIL